MGRASVCRDCHGTIRFILTEAGKPMPVEPIPDKRGNVAARKLSTGDYAGGRVIKSATSRDALIAAGYSIFIPHFATCRTGWDGIRDLIPPQDQLFD